MLVVISSCSVKRGNPPTYNRLLESALPVFMFWPVLNLVGVAGLEFSSRRHRSALNGDVLFPRGEPELGPSPLPIPSPVRGCCCWRSEALFTTPGLILTGLPSKSLPSSSVIARSASSFVSRSTKQYEGLRPEKGSIAMSMRELYQWSKTHPLISRNKVQ